MQIQKLILEKNQKKKNKKGQKEVQFNIKIKAIVITKQKIKYKKYQKTLE